MPFILPPTLVHDPTLLWEVTPTYPALLVFLQHSEPAPHEGMAGYMLMCTRGHLLDIPYAPLSLLAPETTQAYLDRGVWKTDRKEEWEGWLKYFLFQQWKYIHPHFTCQISEVQKSKADCSRSPLIVQLVLKLRCLASFHHFISLLPLPQNPLLIRCRPT